MHESTTVKLTAPCNIKEIPHLSLIFPFKRLKETGSLQKYFLEFHDIFAVVLLPLHGNTNRSGPNRLHFG